jgi:SAM-dependent methyltransferase
MTIKRQMDKIYSDVPLDQIPWNAPTPPDILQQAIEANVPKNGKIIDLGCGTGNYVIWFAQKGYEVTGVDISKNAIEIAKQSASAVRSRCKFIVADVTQSQPGLRAMFDLAYDWELLHHIFPEDRDIYIKNISHMLRPKGKYLSVCFSEDDAQFGGVGKYRKTRLNTTLYFSSEEEMKELFGRYFDVEELMTIDVRSKGIVHKAIYALAKKKSS